MLTPDEIADGKAEVLASIELDYSKIEDVSVAGINTADAPDFCDAYIESASYMGREMSEEELEVLNNDSEYVYEQVIARVY